MNNDDYSLDDFAADIEDAFCQLPLSQRFLISVLYSDFQMKVAEIRNRRKQQ